MKKKGILLCLLMLTQLGIAQVDVKDSIVNLVPKQGEVFRWGYSQLSASDRAIYDTIVGSLLRFDANNFSPYYYHRVDLTGVPNTTNIQVVMGFLECISRDMPEMFILSSSIPRYETNVYYARVGATHTPASYLSDLLRLEAAADTILSGITPGMSDYEKLLRIHDGFINWGDYGGLANGDADAGNIRGALLKKRAVCEGFARAGVYLCQRVGIPCVFVSGKMLTSTVNNTWENHAWNYVQLGGQWYLMDLTADGGFPGICGHSAFLKGQDFFDEGYQLDGAGSMQEKSYPVLPALSATDFDPTVTVSSLPAVGNDLSVPHKLLQNGQFKIEYNGCFYDVCGQLMK